jgi:hypothetical protein
MDNQVIFNALTKQIERQQEVLQQSIQSTNDIVKNFQKSIKFIVVTGAILIFATFSVFYALYFRSNYTDEINAKNTTHNYNENVNRNITDK